jgi:Xaa-Pro aminopeptidase
MNSRMVELMRKFQPMRPRVDAAPGALLDPRDIIHEMRLFKHPPELERMRRAAAISAQAHARAMREARGGMMEWAIEAAIDYTFRSEGAAAPAYPSIVASGPNATILHYITNDRVMRQGELLMIDAGCEYDYYAADISRTFPIASRFTQLQRELYQIVLDAQLKAIESIKPEARVDEVHETALRVLVEGMRAMKMLSGSTDEIIAARSYQRFYMHRTSHWLGMDVHDVGRYRKAGELRRLEPGMVLTVEPGIYISADDDTVPNEMRGIGIRIEDDILVTSDGHELLTSAAPKQIAEIEALTAP